MCEKFVELGKIDGFLAKKYEYLLFAQNKKTFWRAQSLVVLSAG